MDAVAVVEAARPAPDPGRVERLLGQARESGARPVLVLAKCDLVPDPAAIARQWADRSPGVPVLAVSVRRGDGLDAVRAFVTPGRTLALVGRSGAGVSSLVNALAGATVLPSQAARRADGRTSAPRGTLTPAPGGGAVLNASDPDDDAAEESSRQPTRRVALTVTRG
jgi:ribosome biogenesis GTPase